MRRRCWREPFYAPGRMVCRIVLDGRCLCVGSCCCLPQRGLKDHVGDTKEDGAVEVKEGDEGIMARPHCKELGEVHLLDPDLVAGKQLSLAMVVASVWDVLFKHWACARAADAPPRPAALSGDSSPCESPAGSAIWAAAARAAPAIFWESARALGV